MENRRKGGDRRSFRPTQPFPFTDTKGSFLRDCRSRLPDRRLNNLETEWISMALVHNELTLKRNLTYTGELIRTEPRAKRVKG